MSPTPTPLEAALALFDSLPPVSPEALRGAWRGAGWPTGHPMDGALEAYHWWGKRFDGPDAVHPLLMSRRSGATTPVNPLWMLPLLGLLAHGPVPRSALLGGLVQGLLPLLATRRHRARLRAVEYRGQVSACMVYDHLPIHDHFRRLDDGRLLGLMDLKGSPRPFFFVLKAGV